jgi:chromosome segregation ATPase
MTHISKALTPKSPIEFSHSLTKGTITKASQNKNDEKMVFSKIKLVPADTKNYDSSSIREQTIINKIFNFFGMSKNITVLENAIKQNIKDCNKELSNNSKIIKYKKNLIKNINKEENKKIETHLNNLVSLIEKINQMKIKITKLQNEQEQNIFFKKYDTTLPILEKELLTLETEIEDKKETIKKMNIEKNKKTEPLLGELVEARKQWKTVKSNLNQFQQKLEGPEPSIFSGTKELNKLKTLENKISKQFKDFTKNFEGGGGGYDLKKIEEEIKNVNKQVNHRDKFHPGNNVTAFPEELHRIKEAITKLEKIQKDDPDIQKKANDLHEKALDFMKIHNPS